MFAFFCFAGTGVVTSVPSDSPDDYAALRDLKKKQVRTMCTMFQPDVLYFFATGYFGYYSDMFFICSLFSVMGKFHLRALPPSYPTKV